MLGDEHYSRITSAKDVQPAFPSVSASIASLKSTSEDSQRWSKVLEPGEWMRGYKKAIRLSTIPEEPEEQREVEDDERGRVDLK